MLYEDENVKYEARLFLFRRSLVASVFALLLILLFVFLLAHSPTVLRSAFVGIIRHVQPP